VTAAVRQLVERRIGLDPDTLGPSAFAEAVAAGVRAAGVADADAYAGLLEHDPAAFRALVDRLVVPETWFFRGGPLFPYLAKAAAERIAVGRCFRALSLPCSTGEEPYSLAMTLTDAGLPAERWEIDGIDLSPAAVAAAGRGVYREFSFRQTPAEVRARHFRRVPGGWELDEAVRRRVRFRVGNVLDPDPGPDGGYDVILCRNLLIYLSADARRRALDGLQRRLAPDGWLGVGHAEPSAVANRGLRKVGADGLFLFTKAAEPSPTLTGSGTVLFPPPTLRSPSLLGGRVRVGGEFPEAGGSAPAPASSTPHPSPPPQGGREQERGDREPVVLARRLADDGRLADALAACRATLASAPSADGFALLGIILHAAKEPGPAADALRKALYLDPNHREALALAAGLADAGGNAAQAELLRARLARLPAGDSP
jgi:chemotaxis protein methyltransferase WspC